MKCRDYKHYKPIDGQKGDCFGAVIEGSRDPKGSGKCKGKFFKPRNIFSALPSAKRKEVFQVLAEGKDFKIERIVSCGQATAKNKWLCERTAEWVIVLKGRARLLFKSGQGIIPMKPGDYIFIPQNTRHRVDWTHPKQKTVWLAVHVRA